jgi:hypothetical protein
VEAEPLKMFHGTEMTPRVAANGFILPRKDSFDSLIPLKSKGDTISPTSFSVNGIAASSPEKVKRVAQERALNEGRDFLDILDACRPKNSGTIPSALQAILKMYRRCEKVDLTIAGSFNEDSEDDEGDTDELKPLREWTSMDFDLDEPHKLIRPRSASFGLHEKNSERSDGSVLSSPSSSYTSLVGMSFDRHSFARQKGEPPLGGIHLQRSLSLQNVTVDGNDDTDTVKSDGSLSSMGPEGSMDPETDEELAFLKVAQKERNRHAKLLRKIMANHDSSYFEDHTPVVPAAESMIIGRSQLFPPLNEVGNLSPVPGITLSSHR